MLREVKQLTFRDRGFRVIRNILEIIYSNFFILQMKKRKHRKVEYLIKVLTDCQSRHEHWAFILKYLLSIFHFTTLTVLPVIALKCPS